jgi:hypothetical protein
VWCQIKKQELGEKVIGYDFFYFWFFSSDCGQSEEQSAAIDEEENKTHNYLNSGKFWQSLSPYFNWKKIGASRQYGRNGSNSP